MTSNKTKRALDLVWQAQDELWKSSPNHLRAVNLGMAALKDLALERHCSNAYLVLAKAHEGLRNWSTAAIYWRMCQDAYPEGWTREMDLRLEVVLEASAQYGDETPSAYST
ncbi:hypothetical protein PWT90_07844 [Aphanocladium album]|nr:hypothetical protein PWT90_07844 [Aphanocladium album]